MQMPLKVIAQVSAVVLVGSAAIVTASVASASTNEGRTDPAVKAYGSQFYTESQIDAVWANITQSYPEALPAGVRFPEETPGFFHPEDEDAIFEEGLPEGIAALFWRCAWIDASLSSPGSQKAKQAVGKYKDLPFVAETVDLNRQQADINAFAGEMGMDPLEAEFSINCDIYDQEMSAK